MENTQALRALANPCLHCGALPDVYHQDYSGDTYTGDEYSIGCECGIHIDFCTAVIALATWNRRFEEK